MMKKHKYVSFLRCFQMFANKQLNTSKDGFGVGSFAISLNDRANALIVRAHFERLNEVYILRQELLANGRDFIKKFAAVKKSRIFSKLRNMM